ncbi:MAG: tetratricopeptide repeat protein [Verrucomicrobia bacterium]|jgi:outer membrane protein assembly factor BamD|nr:tetratricopeptide repeat protein [Verrucomicrobiota bacterium]
MRSCFITFCTAVFLSAVVPASGQNPSQQGRPAPAPAPVVKISPDDQASFNLAKDYDESGATQQAIAAYRQFIKGSPASPLASKAQYRIAELLESTGDLSKAFDGYQTLITRYPDTPEFEKSVTKQVLIANAFLAGRKLKFFGLEIVPSTDRAEQMFASIIKNAPFSKNAPIAQFNLGLTYERQGKLKEAAGAYQTVLDKYSTSSIADDALYQIGYIYMQVGRSGKSQDLSALVMAKNTFEDFLLQYPNSEKAAQAKDNLASIGGKESGDLLAIAQFYDRYKNYRAAAIYYNDVIRRQPGSKDAEFARSRIETLRSDVGDDALRTGPERAETGEKAALRRRLQAQVETSALSDFNGPSRRDVVPDELPVVNRPKLRTDSRDVRPLPSVEPALPTQ